MERLRPARVASPGTILRREIEARDWTQKDLATIIGRPQQAISEIVRGAKQITPETALEFSEAFGTSPEFWMNLETNYRLHLAEKQKDRGEIARRSKLYSLVPVLEIIKRGWIEASDSIEKLEQRLLSFLEIPSFQDCPDLAVSFRCSTFGQPAYFAQLAWIRRVEQLAKGQPAKGFGRRRLEQSLPALFDLSVDENNVAKVPGILIDLGIRFVVLRHLPKTYIDGVMIPGANPIVGLSLRHNRLDNFWFTLAHELAHIVAGHDRVHVDEEGFEKDTDVDEAQANAIARDWLLDRKVYRGFIASCKGRHFSGEAIQKFALSQSRHPSIALGRLQFEDLVHWRNLRQFHVKVQEQLKDLIDRP